MMIEIARREVLNNLIRFRDSLLEVRQKKDWQKVPVSGKTRVYKVLFNRHTGDLRFAQKITQLEHHFPRKPKTALEDWMGLLIEVHEKGEYEVHFEFKDESGHPLKAQGLDPLAWKIAKETLRVLNLKGKDIHKITPEVLLEEAALQDLSNIHLAPPKEEIEDLPGWAGSINRLQAEQMLTKEPIGTYLLREGDEIIQCSAFHLEETNQVAVHPFVLTDVQKDEKISDILLLQTDKGWTLYQDDPNLDDLAYHFYASPQALIFTLKDFAKIPKLLR